jgi:hypothetical protein
MNIPPPPPTPTVCHHWVVHLDVLVDIDAVWQFGYICSLHMKLQ